MSDHSLIIPSGIPQFTGDLDQLETDTLALTAEAVLFRTSGASVHSTFQGLSAFYKAPEAEQLFATTAPVATKADSFADDLETAASALSAYSTEVRPLVARLKSLKGDALSFVDSVQGDDHWHRDQDKVDHNNDLWHDVNAAVAAFQAAEVTCHDKITALVAGGTHLIADDGTHKPNMYGYSADTLNHAEETPWGAPAEREYTGLAWLGHQAKSFLWDGFVVDGVWGTVKGLGTLFDVTDLDKAGQAWEGLAKLGTGLALSTPGIAQIYWTTPAKELPSWLRDSRKAVKDTGKALVAWDEWGKNPARAAGAVTFNIVTTVFTEGAGTASKTGALAKTASVVGKAGRLVDPMTYIAKAGKVATIKVGDLFAGLKNIHTGGYNDILSGAGRLQPDGTVLKLGNDAPVVTGSHIEWPDGTRLNLDDGSVIRPDGTTAPAHVELSAADRAALENSLPHRQPESVQVGSHVAHTASDTFGRAKGDLPTTETITVPNDLPGHIPSGGANHVAHGPVGSHDPSNQHAPQRNSGTGAHPTGGSSSSHSSNGNHVPGHQAAATPPGASSGGSGNASLGTHGSSGASSSLDPKFVDERIKELDDRQGGQGHAPGRHLYPDDEALRNRLGTVQTDTGGTPKVYGPNSSNPGLLKSENNIDPLTGTTVDGVHGGSHRVGPYATRFDNAEDMVRADAYFRDELARTGAPPAETSIDDVLGIDGYRRLTGYYRDPINPDNFLPVDFEGGTIQPVYRMHDGKWKLHTMFTNPAPGRHP
ncbi:hypothetical protein [Streptomyces sp. NBC_00344]|uniref:hypothetical protein n=1 Tax=Streptomyces sp. NBC_00344 TaxID=2975720 RepID=UPI002E1B8EDD